MVDIAAQLSLTPSGPAIDPAAILGAETADSQAFGNILAGQVQANSDTGAPAAPLPPFPVPAGNRQPGGKILPGAAQILPDTAPLGVEAPAAQVLPSVAAIPPLQLVTTASRVNFASQADIATDAPEPKQVEASPVHGLIKMLTAALKGQTPATDEIAEDAPAETETASAEADTSEQTTVVAVPALAALPFALPILPILTAAAPQATTSDAPRATSGGATPILVSTAPKRADADTSEQIRPALAQLLAQSAPVQSGQIQSGQIQSGTSADGSVVPVLTVAATSIDTPAPAVTLVAAPALPVGQTVAARIKVAGPQGQDGPLAGRDAAAEAPVAASRAAPAVRSVLAERTATDLSAVPATADSQPQLAAAAPISSAPATPAPATGAPVVELPRHDFAALVDRLVEARNASASQSTHASLNHAEFGQVSLHFQQDGDNLKVGMSSADPDFARAAQAAQAVMPAERQNANADTNSRGQSQTQGQSQAGNNSSQAHHEAAGRGERSDQQNRNGQGRNPRDGNNSSNPSPRWADRDQSQSRGGIFA